MDLFQLKFSRLTPSDVKRFLEINNLSYKPLDDDEINDVKEYLYDINTTNNNFNTEKQHFYKVPFTKVLDLVHSRKCFIKDGYAYVSCNDFISIAAHVHEKNIESGLKDMESRLHELETDERVNNLVKEYRKWNHCNINDEADNLPIECLDKLSKESFPLCMRVCHETLRIHHHHKHDGRMQYGLFLRGIGVSLENAIQFWQEEFTKIMTVDQFNKRYTYNIRHLYGQAGSMINQSPWSCMKIVTSLVNPQHTHGCPYRTLNSESLQSKLKSYGLSETHIQEVIKYSSEGYYQNACGRYFEILTNAKLKVGIHNPNQYFELHRRIISGEKKCHTKSVE